MMVTFMREGKLASCGVKAIQEVPTLKPCGRSPTERRCSQYSSLLAKVVLPAPSSFRAVWVSVGVREGG